MIPHERQAPIFAALAPGSVGGCSEVWAQQGHTGPSLTLNPQSKKSYSCPHLQFIATAAELIPG